MGSNVRHAIVCLLEPHRYGHPPIFYSEPPEEGYQSKKYHVRCQLIRPLATCPLVVHTYRPQRIWLLVDQPRCLSNIRYLAFGGSFHFWSELYSSRNFETGDEGTGELPLASRRTMYCWLRKIYRYKFRVFRSCNNTSGIILMTPYRKRHSSITKPRLVDREAYTLLVMASMRC